MPDGLAVLPLDGVLEQVGHVPAAGDAGDVGDPAAGPDRDDEPLVVEGERLQRLASQLRIQITGHRLALFQGVLNPAETQLIFWNGDVEACAEKLIAAGVELLRLPHRADLTPEGVVKQANGDASFMVRDPDGQLIFIIRMAEETRTRVGVATFGSGWRGGAMWGSDGASHNNAATSSSVAHWLSVTASWPR